jgi:1-acyl-sn-glycerol-3-phosphate acyltransferase
MTEGLSLTQPVAASLVTGMARLITGVRGNWQGSLPEPRPRIYFANHRSHGDFVLIWTVLPRALRRQTRPVAAADYWGRGGVTGFFGRGVFNAVLVDREGASREHDPIQPLLAALDAGSSLIFFPEGTRNTTEAPLLPFKSGLYRIASQRPEVELIPVWIENLNRVMPKGEFVPVPLLCTVTFGAPIAVEEGEGSLPFRERSRAALLALAPSEPP